MILDRFTSSSEKWNTLVDAANNGTLFHRLDFLAYHGARFAREQHDLAWYKGKEPVVVMPMAVIDGAEGPVARSPYGASYGGPVSRTALTYRQSRDVVSSLIAHLEAAGIRGCTMTLPIAACYAAYDETFRFVLLEQGFRCVVRDISSVVCLDDGQPASHLVRRHEAPVGRRAGRATRAGVRVVHRARIDDFWPVVEATLAKHGAAPTHTRDEFAWLSDRFPDRVFADVAYLDDQPLAGLGLFVLNRRVITTFYICQVSEHRATQALTLLIQHTLQRSRELGFAWLDFGTSTASMRARENVFLFKESFGAIGQFRDTYVWAAPERPLS